MAEVKTEVAIDQLLAVLQEAFEGPKQAWSYFTDNDPDAGLFGTLSGIDAGQASEIAGTDSVAAHVQHVVFALEASSAWIRGDHSPRKWSDSWSMSSVDGDEWSKLLGKLHEGYDDLRKAIGASGSASVESMGGAVGALAHAAYHLGAIQQKLTHA